MAAMLIKAKYGNNIDIIFRCDADPEVLARYCLALVRKNQPNSELRKSMLEQMDLFLKTSSSLLSLWY